MSFLRSVGIVRSAALRPALSTAPRAGIQVRLASQDYGSGEGNPAGENPQQQGKRGREDLEHPGPPAPKVGQGNKTSPDSSSFSSSSSSSSSKGEGQSSGGSSDKGQKSTKGAQPKILNENPPNGENAPEDVKQHNREMGQRAEKAHEQVSNEDAKDDKVSKTFWSGHGGADRQP